MTVDQLKHAIATVVIALCAGCASSPPAIVQTSRFAVVSTEPASSPIDASDLVDLSPGDVRFDMLDGHSMPSGVVLLRRSATSEHGADVAVVEDDRRTEFLKRNDDGSIALAAVIEVGDNVLTLFDPPLVIAPATLEPGVPFTSEAAMRVVALDNPRKQRERGTAKRTISYSNDAVLRLAGGEVRTAQVEVHFEADLRFADADERTTMFISREQGVIRQDTLEKITILGAFPREARRTLVRTP